MITRSTPPRGVAALVTGVGTALYYATPDLISSRTARGWVKAGLTAVTVAATAPELRAAWTAAREGLSLDGENPSSTSFSSLPTGSKVLVLGPVAAVLVSAVGWLIRAERWVFRRGQARSADGKRLPHTGPALLYGALASGLWLLPTPSDPHRGASAG